MRQHRFCVPSPLVHRVWLHAVLLLRVVLWFVTTSTPWYTHLPMSRGRMYYWFPTKRICSSRFIRSTGSFRIRHSF